MLLNAFDFVIQNHQNIISSIIETVHDDSDNDPSEMGHMMSDIACRAMRMIKHV